MGVELKVLYISQQTMKLGMEAATSSQEEERRQKQRLVQQRRVTEQLDEPNINHHNPCRQTYTT